MSKQIIDATSLAAKPIQTHLDRDDFLTTLLGTLAGTLEEVVGTEESSGYISLVSQEIGDWINQKYKSRLGISGLDRDQVAAVLLDLMYCIQGDFYLISLDDEKIVLGNRACPYGDKVKGRPSLCMTTSTIFGTISADSLGYAKVCLQQTIATGNAGCHVVIYTSKSKQARDDLGAEYFLSKR